MTVEPFDLAPTTATRRRNRLRDALNEPMLRRRTIASIPTAMRLHNGAPTLASVLAPESVQRHGVDLLRTGDSYLQTLEVRGFPAQLDLGWMYDPTLELDAPGVTVQQQIEPIADADARKLLTRSENVARGTLNDDARKGTSGDETAEQGGSAALTLRHAIAAKTDRMYQYVVTITVSGSTPEHVTTQTNRIREAAAARGLNLAVGRLLQWQGWQSTLPLGYAPDLLRHDTNGHAIAMGLPLYSGGIDPRGGRALIWGRHARSYQPLFWDRWKGVNPHGVVIGESGNGKSYTIGGLLVQEWALGDEAILILDPKFNEYRRLVRNLGGAYVTLSARSQYHINPLELPRLSADRRAALAADGLETDLLGERVAFVKTLLVQELNASGTPVDGVGSALISVRLRQPTTGEAFQVIRPRFRSRCRPLAACARSYSVWPNTIPMPSRLPKP